MNCEIEECGGEGSKWRGSGVHRICLCVAHYTEATKRPGQEVRTGLERPAKPPESVQVAPEAVQVAVPPPAKPYAPVERVSARVLQLRAEADARYQALLQWLPADRLVTASEVATALGCTPAQAAREIRRGVAAGTIRAWASQGYSVPGFERGLTHVEKVYAYLKEHGESRVSAIAEGTGLKWKSVKTAAKADRRVESFGVGVLRVRK